jgi:hypothetical protein
MGVCMDQYLSQPQPGSHMAIHTSRCQAVADITYLSFLRFDKSDVGDNKISKLLAADWMKPCG